MKLLKPSIFYPKEYNEVSISKMKKIRKKYDAYLFQIKGKYNIELFDLYKKTEEFHDYIITKIDFIYNKNVFNQVSLFIHSHNENEKYHLVFEEVNKFAVNSIIPDIEEITLCEIGMTKKVNYIYFHFADGTELEIKFQNVIILQFNM